MTSETEFLTSYEQIKTSYSNVMKSLEAAVTHEEHERPMEAIESYGESVRLIEEAFITPVGLPENIKAVESEWNDACATIQKMKSAKSEAMYRLKFLRAKHAPIESAYELKEEHADESQPIAKKRSYIVDNPVTYFDITNDSGKPTTYREIMKGLRDLFGTEASGVSFDILFQSSAKLYKIQPHGVVSTIDGDTEISLVLLSTATEKLKYLNGMYFIQCKLNKDDKTRPSGVEEASSTVDIQPTNLMWVYPLVPTITNCFHTEYGAFILPDLECIEPGTAFGIIISDQTESQQFFLDLLEAILPGEVIEIKEQVGSQVPRDTSTIVSRRIVSAADFIARNLVKGAEKTGNFMITSTPYLISKMAPAPSNAPPVSGKVQTSVEVAKNVTGVAAGVTGWVAGKVGTASMALGRCLAPHIQTKGATLLEKGFGYNNEDAQEKMQGALTIAAGAVEGFSTVYRGLEDSAKILGTNLSNNSVKIIEHKYGPSAGVVASGTFDTLGNVFNVSQNVNYITPKGIAKGMAKKTGKAVFVDYKNEIRKESHYVPAGVLYPDLRGLKEAYPK